MAVTKTVGVRKAPAKPKKVASAAERALVEGYRSGLEERIAEELAKAGEAVRFEVCKIPFVQPVKPRTYTPDFILSNGIIIETKGRFVTDDRAKHKLIKEQHPDLDIRFVFSSSKTKLSKGSPTSYGKWCADYGFQYADKSIPSEWLSEPSCERRIAALEAIAIKPKTPKQGA